MPRLYDVRGEDRQINAIGRFERFDMQVYADDEDNARVQVRAARADAGREHVHIQSVSESKS